MKIFINLNFNVYKLVFQHSYQNESNIIAAQNYCLIEMMINQFLGLVFEFKFISIEIYT